MLHLVAVGRGVLGHGHVLVLHESLRLELGEVPVVLVRRSLPPAAQLLLDELVDVDDRHPAVQ